MAHHAQNPRLRPVMSQEQRGKLSAAQKNYVAHDPRWVEHRAKLVAAMNAAHKKLTLCEDEIKQIVVLRKKGRNFRYIEEELCVGRDVIRRELKVAGIALPSVGRRRAKRGKGFWRCFDEP